MQLLSFLIDVHVEGKVVIPQIFDFRDGRDDVVVVRVEEQNLP